MAGIVSLTNNSSLGGLSGCVSSVISTVKAESGIYQAENYSADLLSDLSKRQSFDMSAFRKDIQKLQDLKKVPSSIKEVENPQVLERLKNIH